MGDIAGSSVLITGGAGFVGSNLAEAFVAQGARVRVFDNLATGHMGNLLGIDVEFVRGDIRDAEAIAKACVGVDYVLHHAAIASVPESMRDPLGTSEVNITGTLNVLAGCASSGVKRLVFASSASVYGQGGREPIPETLSLNPCSPYAAAKAAGELMCQAYSASLGVETVALRYFNIFGPRQDPRSHYAGVIPAFADSIQRGESAVLFGDGHQTRDFVYVGDVVQANLKACFAEEASGRAINIGHGTAVSILEVAQALSRVMGLPLTIQEEPPRNGDVRYSCSDITLAQTLLAYSPQISFEQGLESTMAWFMGPERQAAAG